MNRREFVRISTRLLMGSWLTASGYSRALAGESCHRHPFPTAALIIDDIGHCRRAAAPFLAVDTPITYAVLPRLACSRGLAREIHARGHEIMLHQPMEAIDPANDPGPGALYVKTGANDIRRMVEENLASVPHAAGVNNHMGSRFTQTGGAMAAALSVVRRHALFFIDSLTSGRSVAHQTALQLGIPCARRSVFLDNIREEAAVTRQLEALERKAVRWGRAVGIGHPFPQTAAAVAKFFCDGRGESLSWVYASKILS